MASRATPSQSIGKMITKCNLLRIGKIVKFLTKANIATWTTSLKIPSLKSLHSSTLNKKTGKREKYLFKDMVMLTKMNLRKRPEKL